MSIIYIYVILCVYIFMHISTETAEGLVGQGTTNTPRVRPMSCQNAAEWISDLPCFWW